MQNLSPLFLHINTLGIHSKQAFEYVEIKTSSTLSLSHVLKALIAIQIEGKIACDCPTLNDPSRANARSIFARGVTSRT
jgi:hypothetical protein